MNNNEQEQAKMEALAYCVFPWVIEDAPDALKLALCFPKARTAVRTVSFWMPWLRRDLAELRAFVSNCPQYVHLADVISSSQYQMLPPAMLHAGGVRAVVESKRSRHVGPRLEPLVYLEERWESPTSNARVSICYRHDSVQIVSTETSSQHEMNQWDEQWQWKKLRYHGRTRNLINQVPFRSGAGIIHMSNNVRFEGQFEYLRGSNVDVLPFCSTGFGSLIWEIENADHTMQLQRLEHVECTPVNPQNEWGDLCFRHEQRGMNLHIKQSDGILLIPHIPQP